MSIELNRTEYETNYDNNLRAESEKSYREALEAAKAEKAGKTTGILQTGNTGPSKQSQTVSAEERQFESAAAYLEFLNLTYPDSIFSFGDFSGDASELSGIGSILLSPKLVDRMLEDSIFRMDMEKSIAEITEAERGLKSWYESNGANVLGHGAVIDADGKSKTWSFTLEDTDSMEKLGSTDAFMKLEALREKTMNMKL